MILFNKILKIMKIKNLFILLALAGMVFSCTPKAEDTSNNTEYFRHIQFTETPYDQITGIYPLSKEEAKEINHYRFDYNENGKLAEVSFRRGTNLLSYSSLGSPVIKIEYLPGKEIQTYFDKDGKQQKRVGAWKAVYKLDENGNRTGLSFEDKDGNKMTNRNEIAYYTWKVLDDGMVQEKRYNLKDEETVMNPFCPFYELRFSYDNAGRPVRMANYMADTFAWPTIWLTHCTIVPPKIVEILEFHISRLKTTKKEVLLISLFIIQEGSCLTSIRDGQSLRINWMKTEMSSKELAMIRMMSS